MDRNHTTMTAALIKFPGLKGDSPLPHSPETGEELLRLFHAARRGEDCSVDSILGLMSSDAGFASNVTRLLQGDGLAADGSRDMRECIAAFTPLRVIATLATVEWDTDR